MRGIHTARTVVVGTFEARIATCISNAHARLRCARQQREMMRARASYAHAPARRWRESETARAHAYYGPFPPRGFSYNYRANGARGNIVNRLISGEKYRCTRDFSQTFMRNVCAYRLTRARARASRERERSARAEETESLDYRF